MATRAVGRVNVLARIFNNRTLPSVCIQCAKRVAQIHNQRWSIRVPHVSLSVKHFSSEAQSIKTQTEAQSIKTQITEMEHPQREKAAKFVKIWPKKEWKVGNPAAVEDTDEIDDLYKRIIIEVKGHDPEIIKSYTKFFVMTAQELDIPIHYIHTPDKDIERLTLLKSVHVYKKHRVQYEARTHYKQFELLKLTGSTADTLLEYVQRNLPEGMAMKVTKERLERLPDHLQSPLKGSTSTPKATELQSEAS